MANINTRIKNKHDTEAHWNNATNFIPLAGEIIVYDMDSIYPYPRFKVGDGKTSVSNLPFSNSFFTNLTTTRSLTDSYDTRITANGEYVIDGSKSIIKRISGQTVKTTNLIPRPYEGGSSSTHYGVTYTVNDDGSITANGTSTGPSQFKLVAANTVWNKIGTFTVSCVGADNVSIQLVTGGGNSGLSFAPGERTETFSSNMNWGHFIIQVPQGQTVNNVTVYPMMNEGSKALPYQQWFGGLKNTYFNSLISTGRNLWTTDANYPIRFGSANAEVVTYDEATQVYTFLPGIGSVSQSIYTLPYPIPVGTPVSIRIEFLQGEIASGTIDVGGYHVGINGAPNSWQCDIQFPTGVDLNGRVMTKNFVTTETLTDYWIFLYSGYNITTDIKFRVHFQYGNAAPAFEPYISHELSLDTAIELPAWDSINPTTGKRIVQSNTLTFDGTESGWYIDPPITPNIFSTVINVPDAKDSNSLIATIAKGFSSQNPDSNTGCYIIVGNLYSYFVVWFRQSAYPNVTDLASAKAQLAAWNTAGDPLTVCYRTATATESDLTLQDDILVYNRGSETIIQGTNDNSTYGALCTITQEYMGISQVISDISIDDGTL